MTLDTVLLALSPGWVRGIQFFVALSILILLHEWGHYYAAKKTGTRVEKFYLFFDFLFPFSTVLPFSLFKKKIGDTEYGLGWFPMGGYVKIAGMVDESMDKEQLAKPPEPWEFRSKTAPQRLLIMLGGIIMNILLAIVVHSIIFGVYGEEHLPIKNAKYGIACDSNAKAAGLQDGDEVVSINNKPIVNFEDITKTFVMEDAKTVKVLRNGVEKEITIPAGTLHTIIKQKKGGFITPRIPIEIDSTYQMHIVNKESVLKNDKIIGFNGTPISYNHEFKNAIHVLEIKKAVPITGFKKTIHSLTGKGSAVDSVPTFDTTKVYAMQVLRNGKDTISVDLHLKEDGTIGFFQKSPLNYFTYDTVKYNFLQCIPKGISYTWEKLGEYMGQFKLLFTSKEVKVNDSLGGFASMASVFPSVFDMESFLRLLGFLSVVLAFMNFLPIPGLDGGYVFFLLYEMISGRTVSEKIMEKATTVGLVLLLGLMVYANGLDIYRWMFP